MIPSVSAMVHTILVSGRRRRTQKTIQKFDGGVEQCSAPDNAGSLLIAQDCWQWRNLDLPKFFLLTISTAIPPKAFRGVGLPSQHSVDARSGRDGLRKTPVQNLTPRCETKVQNLGQGTAGWSEAPFAAKAGLGHPRPARTRCQSSGSGFVQTCDQQQAARL